MNAKLLSGTVDLLILEVISTGPNYGYEIAQQVIRRSNGSFELKEGSLYPSLHRMERQKLLKSDWREADGRRRKYYQLTAAGRRVLTEKRREWREFAKGVEGVLGVTYGMA